MDWKAYWGIYSFVEITRLDGEEVDYTVEWESWIRIGLVLME